MLSPFDPNLPMYLPCTATLVDDDEMLLCSLRKALDQENAILAFSETDKALQHIYETEKIAGNVFRLFSPYCDAESDDDLILLETSTIQQLAASEDRYKIISVLIIDQNMPSITGLEFCSLIKETGVKVILLTGQITDQRTIDAFNNGLINRYINKNDPDVLSTIKKMMTELHLEYLGEKLEPVIQGIEISSRQLFKHPAIKTIMTAAHELFPYTEYYYTPRPAGFLLYDDNGRRNFCLLGREQQQMELADIIEDECGPCEDAIKLRSGDFMAWDFFDDGNEDQPWTDKINDLIFPCQESGGIRWSLIPLNDTPYRHTEGLFAWETYKQELQSMPLNYGT